MKTQTPNQAKKGKMKKRETERMARKKLHNWMCCDSFDHVVECVCEETIENVLDSGLIKEAIAQEREQVLGKVEKYFRENYIAGHIEDDEELIILKGWSDKWFKFLNSLRTQEKREK